MSHRRNRTKQTLTLTQRLMKAAEEARAKASNLEPGKERDELLSKARQFEGQIGVNGFFETPGSELN